MDNNEMKVKVKNITTNTVLSRDVVADNGFVLVTKDTMLNDRIISMLKEMNINSVFVKTVDYSMNEGSAKQKPIVRGDYMLNLRGSFLQFENHHRKMSETVQECLENIGKGGSIDINTLFKMTDEIISGMQLKTDLLAYLSFLKASSNVIYAHCLNVSLLCNLFGRWLGLQKDELEKLTVAGLLHDIGNSKIPEDILKKPGKLTDEEFNMIKNHPTYGYEMIKDQPIDLEIKKAVLSHHEKINGTGYPIGLQGDQIGKYAKIVAICDVYDAMTADWTFRSRVCPFKVIKDFETNRYSDFDTYYLLVFLRNIAYAYVSSYVLLSNNKRAEIVFINSGQLSRPIVLTDDMFVDLSKERHLDITEII